MFHAHNVTPICSGTLTINHVAGTVAPETKTVTYGLVQTGLSGMSKCWITQNLGADNQASSAGDNTNAAAGWYWQFNRMQGYKHDGTTRTPGTAWITPISEAGNWLAANDPCSIELGVNWRIPTYTEWANAHTNGAWASYFDPYNSVLKVHGGAGYINSTGTLTMRGSFGLYCSSSTFSNTNPYSYILSISLYGPYWSSAKANGYSLRCIKD